MFRDQLPPLSSLARDLLAKERGRSEDEAIKERALERARGALTRDRPSGVGLRPLSLAGSKRRPRRLLRTLPLIAAALAAAGLAVAGAREYFSRTAVTGGRTLLTASVPAVSSPSKAQPSAPPPASDAASGAVTTELPTESSSAPAALGGAGLGGRSLGARQYATELALLEPARSSISRGDYASALVAIAKHRREFPSGALAEEREALRVRALWGVGQKPAATAAAAAFHQRYPRSALLGWMKDRGL